MIRILAVALSGLFFVGCATTSGLLPEQQVSIVPYQNKVKDECIKLRVPEKQKNTMSDKDIETLCQSRANRFADLTMSNLSQQLNNNVIEKCRLQGEEQKNICLIEYQERFFEGAKNRIVEFYKHGQ